jgi:hypothetical protein
MSPPIPLVMKIIILFDWRMEYFLCLIGLKNFHPKINWRANHFQFSLALKGWGDHWLEGRILKLPLDNENKFKERSWRLTKGEKSILCWGKKKGGEWMCEEKISSYVWKGVVHEKRCVQEISMEGFPWQRLWIFISNSYSSQIHRWICVELKTIFF